ncbi:MAG: hypothetical protein Q8O65_03185 [Nitrosopumilaceae archaeon]|nr:hypothetical protein [Nitrosopumilaceae archaeon]
MTQSKVLQIAHKVMKEDHNVLSALGSEKPVKIKKFEEENTIEQLIKLLPKSTEGKILVGIATLLAIAILKSK